MPGLISYESSHNFFVAIVSDCELACRDYCPFVSCSHVIFCSVWYDNLLRLELFSYENERETLYLHMGSPSLENKNTIFTWEVLNVVVVIWIVKIKV